MINFNGKRVLVTGASSGIGKATCIQLSKLGAEVILISRNTENLNKVIDQMAGNNHKAYSVDLADHHIINDKIKSIIGETGILDGLFHCAGQELIRPIKLVKEKHIEEIFNTSIIAGLLLTKAFSSKINSSDNSKSIVLMSSVAAKVGQVGLSTYSASKGAIDAAVKSLAVELSEKKIRVNSIVAGAVKTEMHERITKNLSEESIKNYENQHLLGLGTPEDIANAACFLLSSSSKWITGTNLVIDGGYTCK